MSDDAKPTEPPTAEVQNLKIENGDHSQQQPSSPSPTPSTPTPSTPTPSTPTKSSGTGTFEDQFKSFSKFGDPKADGKHITLSQSDKWMKQAKVIDGKKITTTDTGIYFKKLKSVKLSIIDYKKFLEDLAKAKKVEFDEIKEKLAGCGQPGVTGIGLNKTTGTVNRLTDTSKYTGTHKQRFDDTGKGKGIAGRKDLVDGSGYVTGYQNKDSFKK